MQDALGNRTYYGYDLADRRWDDLPLGMHGPSMTGPFFMTPSRRATPAPEHSQTTWVQPSSAIAMMHMVSRLHSHTIA